MPQQQLCWSGALSWIHHHYGGGGSMVAGSLELAELAFNGQQHLGGRPVQSSSGSKSACGK
jgi:hypothetical protein